MEHRYRLLLILSFLILGFILRLNNLAKRSLWTDEFYTLFQSTGHGNDIKHFLDDFNKQNFPKLYTAQEYKGFLKNETGKGIKEVSEGVLNTDAHPPLYFWLMYFWMKFFAAGALPLRLFSVFMGLICIFLVYKVSQHLFDENTAIFSALFLSISAFGVRFAQEGRSYSLLMALGLLSSFFILRFERYKNNYDLWGFIIANCLGIYTHYFYIFISIAQFLYFTITNRSNTLILKRFSLAFLGSGVPFLPYFILALRHKGSFQITEWAFGYPGIINKIYYLFVGFSRYLVMFDKYPKSLLIALFILIFLFFYLAFFALKEMVKKYPKSFLFCLALFLIPILFIFSMDIVKGGVLLKQIRFWTFSFIGFILLAGYILHYIFSRNRFAAYFIMLFMLISSFNVGGLEFGPSPKYISFWINQEAEAKPSAVIVYNIRSIIFGQAYYLDDGVFLIPVSDTAQFDYAIKTLSNKVDKIFVVHHYHPTESFLRDRTLLGEKNIFKLKARIASDYINVSEFVK